MTPHRGQPGQPGQPGQLGQLGGVGGRGGAGGAGGQGGVTGGDGGEGGPGGHGGGFARVRSRFALVVMLAALTVLLVVEAINSHDQTAALATAVHRQDAALADAIHGICHRLNIVRRNQNINARAIYIDVSIERHGDLSHTIGWTPLTDCRQAVAHPDTFVPPQPVLFIDHALDWRGLRIGPNN